MDDMQDELSTGMSFDDAWVHYNLQLPEKPDAPAYIKGNQVEIGPGLEHPADEIGAGQRVDVIQKKADSVVQRALDGPRAIAVNDLKKCVEEAYNIFESIIGALNAMKSLLD